MIDIDCGDTGERTATRPLPCPAAIMACNAVVPSVTACAADRLRRAWPQDAPCPPQQQQHLLHGSAVDPQEACGGQRRRLRPRAVARGASLLHGTPQVRAVCGGSLAEGCAWVPWLRSGSVATGSSPLVPRAAVCRLRRPPAAILTSTRPCARQACMCAPLCAIARTAERCRRAWPQDALRAAQPQRHLRLGSACDRR